MHTLTVVSATICAPHPQRLCAAHCCRSLPSKCLTGQPSFDPPLISARRAFSYILRQKNRAVLCFIYILILTSSMRQSVLCGTVLHILLLLLHTYIYSRLNRFILHVLASMRCLVPVNLDVVVARCGYGIESQL